MTYYRTPAPPPAIIAKAAGAQIEQARGEFGSLYTITDRDGETRFRTNRKDAATAWLEGYTAGRKDARLVGELGGL